MDSEERFAGMISVANYDGYIRLKCFFFSGRLKFFLQEKPISLNLNFNLKVFVENLSKKLRTSLSLNADRLLQLRHFKFVFHLS